MFFAEFDRDGEEVASNQPASVETQGDCTVSQVTIETDATAGLVTFSSTPRRGQTPEPVFQSDDITQVVVDLSTGRRTTLIPAGTKLVSTTAAGMNGTVYRLLSSGGDL